MDFERRDPDEIIQNLKDKFKFRSPKPISIPLIVGIIILFLLIKGSLYTIQANEVGVVLRFGRFLTLTKPGLHFKLPFGVDQAIPVRVDYNYKEEFGFRTRKPGVRTIYQKRGYSDESLMLTGDLNVLNVQWIVQYKIKDPYKALFRVKDVETIRYDPSENVKDTLRDISESVMRKVIGDYSFNEVLSASSEEGAGLTYQVQNELQKILDSYETGLDVVTVKLQAVLPPNPVKPAFNEVNEAKQQRETLINEARKYYNQKIPQAKGEAEKIVRQAEGYALEKINNAKGDARRFILLQKEYAQAKDVTKKRLYLEQMNKILSKTGKKYILDPEQKGILPLLRLEDEQK